MFICLKRMSSIANRIRRHLSDPESHHRKIATGFVWVALFVFIGKLAGAAKEMAIAWRYGVSETVDAYVLDAEGEGEKEGVRIVPIWKLLLGV